jgi:NitT/TauT family transport system permease protein
MATNPSNITIQQSDQRASWLVDVLLLSLFAGLVFATFEIAGRWAAPVSTAGGQVVQINLSPWALPGYALQSLARGVVAYGFSLVFCLVYGTIAAKSVRAERVMIPLLDILQGIPVLGFLPGLVLGMVALFPGSNLGLELACVLMIFTGQVWNMVFSYYGSVRTVPSELREVARLHKFGAWKTFRTVELPWGAIPLVWNSMISMAGGWFFLTINESFRLEDRDFRLPGIGSYMSEAIDKGDWWAMGWGVLAMVIMITAVDQLVWRPLAVWSQRFKMADVAEEQEESWVLDFLRRSHTIRRIKIIWHKWRFERTQRGEDQRIKTLKIHAEKAGAGAATGLTWLIAGALVVFAAWGGLQLFELLAQVHGAEWVQVMMALAFTFGRTTLAILLSAAWAVPIGVMIGRSRSLSRRFQPVVQSIASFPAPMVFPLIALGISKLGVNFEIGCVALMMVGSQWYILFNVISGAQRLPQDLIETARLYGVRGWTLWRTLYLPAIFPALIPGMVTAAGGAWNASIVSELVRLKGDTYEATGLGSLITRATESGNFPLLCAGILTMSTALVILNRFIWKPLFALADSRYTLNR